MRTAALIGLVVLAFAGSAAASVDRSPRQLSSLTSRELAGRRAGVATTVGFFRHHRWMLASRHSSCWSHVPWARTCNVARLQFRARRSELAAIDRRLAQLAKPKPLRAMLPSGWYQAALCIHSREGAWNSNTGNGYYGGMQFLLSTWRSVGGKSYPHLVSPREQLYRAFLVWQRDGGSWREWSTRGACGV